MSDLVKRLRSDGETERQRFREARATLGPLLAEAANRIEQLEAALRSVSVEFDDTYSPASREGRLGRLARAALEEK